MSASDPLPPLPVNSDDIVAIDVDDWHERVIHRARELGGEAREARDRFDKTRFEVEKTWQELIAAREGLFGERKMRQAALNLLEDTEMARRAEAQEAVSRLRAEARGRESESRYRTLFERMDEAFCIIQVLFDEAGERSVDYRFLEVNPAFERHTGILNATGRTIREFVPGHDEYWFEVYGHIALTGEPCRFEGRAEALGRDYDVYAFRVGEPAEHKVAALFRDVTDIKREAKRRAFLFELSDAIQPLAQAGEVAVTTCRLLGNHLRADRVLFSELTADGETVVIPHCHVSGNVPPLMGRLRVPPNSRTAALLKAGQSVVVREPADLDPVDRAAMRVVGVEAAVTVPLVKDGRWMANLSVQQCVPRDWDSADVELIQEVAARTWAAVETARAEEALRASEEKYRRLFQSMDEGVLTLEVIIGSQGKAIDCVYLDANPALLRREAIVASAIGRRAGELGISLPQEHLDRYDRIVRTGCPERFEQQGLNDRWFDVYVARVDGPGSRRLVCLYNDITERLRREANLALLAEVSTRFPSSGAWRDLLKLTGQIIRKHFGFLTLGLFECDPVRGVVSLLHDRPAEEDSGRQGYQLWPFFSPEDICRLEAGEMVALNHLPPGAGPADEPGARAVLGAPYVAEGRLRFVIVGTRDAPLEWREDEIDLLRQLAAHIYLRLERSRANVALREAHAQLETRVEERTRELARALEQLQAEVAIRQRVEGERMDLLKRQMKGQEDERLRISRDLHDNLGQHMVGVMLGLSDLKQEDPPDMFARRLQNLREVLDAFIQGVRRQAWELRPAELEHLGLEHALRYYVDDWSERTGIDAAFLCDEREPAAITSEEMVALYRVTQEALTNIHRHAKASSVVVQLEFTPRTALSVEDDGVGFDVEQVGGRLGLVGMKERLMIVGGTLEIDSEHGRGTRVIATLAQQA